jgi:hypothetical protein
VEEISLLSTKFLIFSEFSLLHEARSDNLVATGRSPFRRFDSLVKNQWQHSFPEMAARPSLIKNGISASAATLSNHHQPNSQVAANPTMRTMER